MTISKSAEPSSCYSPVRVPEVLGAARPKAAEEMRLRPLSTATHFCKAEGRIVRETISRKSLSDSARALWE